MLKIPARLPVFLGTLNLVASPPKILHSNFCLYIFEGFFLEKRKIRLLDIVEIENNKKRHFLKNASAFERTIHIERISRWSFASLADL